MKNRHQTNRRPTTTRAFTLVELLLSVSLLLLLATAVIVNFGTLDRGARLTEGATLMESLLRYARAQSANTGRQVKVVFGAGSESSGGTGVALDASNSGVRVLWEPDPLGAPGKFEPLIGAAQLVDEVNDVVRVREVRQLGANLTTASAGTAYAAFTPTTAGNTNATVLGEDCMPVSTPPVTCYPDGSSDSVEIILSPQDDEDLRRSVVSLSGVTGALKHRPVLLMADGTETPEDVTPTTPATTASPDK